MTHRAGINDQRLLTVGAVAASRCQAPCSVRSHVRLGLAAGMHGSRSNRASPSPTTFALSRELPAASGRPLRVLIVEDEAIIAMDIEMMLQDLGAQVVGVAMTAAEAVRLAELHRPDCATMDINIKGERDGVSAATEIYETLSIRSVFVSAYGNDETRQRAAPAHPFGWIKKPLEMNDLKLALDRVIDTD